MLQAQDAARCRSHLIDQGVVFSGVAIPTGRSGPASHYERRDAKCYDSRRFADVHSVAVLNLYEGADADITIETPSAPITMVPRLPWRGPISAGVVPILDSSLPRRSMAVTLGSARSVTKNGGPEVEKQAKV